MQRRVRKKSLNLGDSSDMNHTPDQVRQSIASMNGPKRRRMPLGRVHLPAQTGLARFDRIGQGYTMRTTTTDLVLGLQRRQEIVRVCKEAAPLI